MSHRSEVLSSSSSSRKADILELFSVKIRNAKVLTHVAAENPHAAEGLRTMAAYRKKQVALFPKCALNYPSWDILLLCFQAQTDGKPLYVKQIECQLSETHAALLRRIAAMENAGIIMRCRDDGDWRRTQVMLTVDGISRMLALLKWVRERSLP